MRSALKRTQISTLLVLFMVSFAVPAASAASKAGSPCTKAGATAITKGSKFTCILSGKKLVWNKGVPVAKPVSPRENAKGIKSDYVFMSDFLGSLKNVGVDCKGYTKKEDPSLLAKEEGKCTYNGVEIFPVLFGMKADELVQILKGFGGFWIYSNNWALLIEDEATAKDLQSKLGIPVR